MIPSIIINNHYSITDIIVCDDSFFSELDLIGFINLPLPSQILPGGSFQIHHLCLEKLGTPIFSTVF